MINYLKKNWLNILLSIIAALSGADAAVGIRGGKSPMNLTVIPSILAALGASGTLGVRWLNNRQVMARVVRQGLEPDFTARLENLFLLARDPDVTPDHASHLADMAGDLLLAEHRRAKLRWLEENQKPQVMVPVQPVQPTQPQFPAQSLELEDLWKQIEFMKTRLFSTPVPPSSPAVNPAPTPKPAVPAPSPAAPTVPPTPAG